MRTEQEIFDLVLGFAKNDDRIRAVGMEGSRMNKNVPRDIFQDYDMSYIVTDMDSFISDKHWIDVFGERIILQTPEAMSLFPPELGNWFSYLMLFADGTRIDLLLIPIAESELYYKSDKLVKILLDKDGIFPALPEPSDEDYHVKRPSEGFLADCCNEFWWVSTYVAKGLWRKEILYANYHLDTILRPCLLRMMEWKVGIETDFSLSVGKNSKYLSRYVTPEVWNTLLSTYNNGSYEDCWASLSAMIQLFRDTALFVAKALGYKYNVDEDRKASAYLCRIKDLPEDALSFW
ncbi:aminoglycoside 6-adenylyltransferase [Dysgonomonas sp. PFB1-18]|uniref:aminoglycoside 6-adenylyltransferase n=1 Tax=unclassified Dysgonomonas TaxID=2630389 RepID=UPI002472FA37|nr:MULTISPECIES: aminoglycoside 6-adenylyltransferase [unclassified Dysgonomonas]MDH6311040.1 aminoglycoside 6-adenylyltransferase [Dysgonomonas sp. PF1-14]MDH6337889.1 aminoglycoside 6-adenylyltransferase [Dysgonomonas sp. PF1-16]MDH6382588.1 aminoglycoside 6-adenylyltransferase [Dysgonomonas sp. PFB1-18]MDH6398021.1 aminoglycoside 6-adenylyltransferase [Dysgonomonas sp. PF1-23]